ncbi:MAG: hypothetical protein K2X99_05225, partial [Gemmatimonadaceae bacterium]|nr:hypothetical protein [Gemmatimonadaceae bacterium]
MTETLATPPPQKPKFRPPVGLPVRAESRVGGAVASMAFHLLIFLLIAGPLFVRQVLDPTMGGAGGAGPAGGGGGGRGGSGGE